MKKMNAKDILTYEYLKYVHKDLEVKEIAEQTGCGKSTVRKYLHLHNLSIKNSHKGKCMGENHGRWKGGRVYNEQGYIMKRVGIGKYKREHILVAEEYLGRNLKSDERVHHLNGVRDDNRPCNLLVLNKKEHDRYHLIMRNKNLDYKLQSAQDVLNILNKGELKMYADLAQIQV